MSIQTNSPSTNLGTSVSADGIAQLLGFADAAAMVASIGQYCIAGGTTNAYTATPAIPWTSYSDGDRITVRVPNFVNTGASTINVSGLGTKNIYKMSQGSNVALTGYELYYGHMATLVYSSLASGFILESSFSLRAADIPSTLNATTFAGDILPIDSAIIKKSSNDGVQILAGGVGAAQSSGAISYFFGNFHGSNAGDALHYTGSAAGAAHSFFDKNGVERQRIQEDGAACLSPVVSVGTSFTTLCAVAGNQALIVATVTGTGSILLEWDGSTLTKLAGVSTLVVAGSAGAGETAFRVSGGNLQAIVDTGTRNVSSGFSVRH